MESSKAENVPHTFIEQLLSNNMLMLTVLLIVSAVAYLGFGLYMLVR